MQKPRALILRLAPFLLARFRHPRDLMWPVSSLTARSLMQARGVETRVLDTWQRPQSPAALLEQVRSLAPDWLFIETRTPTAQTALELARSVRRHLPHTRIWGIGQHPSEKPDDFLFEQSPFAGCASGELEPVLPRIVDGEAAPPGTCVWDSDVGSVRSPGGQAMVTDPDSLPLLDPSGLELDRYQMLSLHVPRFGRLRWGFLLTSRGCAYPCIFCSPTLRQSYGTGFRGQSGERVAEELAHLHRRFGVNAFYAIDDLFTGDLKRVHEICDAILRRNLKVQWTIQTRLDHLDRELLRHLKAAGCAGIKVGIESGSPRVSALIRKELDPDRAIQMSEELRRVGITLTACYLVGNPTERLEEMEATFRFARRIGAVMIQVAFHTPYPGSQSYQDYASHLEVRGRSHFDGPPLNLSEVDDATLVRFHRNFYLRYYLHPAQIARYLLQRAPFQLSRTQELELLARTASYLARESVRRTLRSDHAHPLET